MPSSDKSADCCVVWFALIAWVAKVYFLRRFFFGRILYRLVSGLNCISLYVPFAVELPFSDIPLSIKNALLLTVPSSLQVGLSTSIAMRARTEFWYSGISVILRSPLSSGSMIHRLYCSFMRFIIPQIPNTVNLRRLFSFIRHKIKIVIIFIICRMMCATYFLPRVHIYLWEKSVSIGEFGVNFRGVNSVNFWNI